ncbi:MAG TPA: c-type cytochrome [Candidatus Limnocylindrales bacterium]|nr:c-type cytochrome [Candidatus Limnocylindrales bacterium]
MPRVPGFLRLFVCVVLFSIASLGQIPDKFTNLQVLPKDISKSELTGIMRNFAGDLGVRCGFCHVGGDPNTLQGVNFSSDESDKKKTARAMMRMVKTINQDYVQKLGKTPAATVSCVTCHRGMNEPQTIDSVVQQTMAHDGIEAAIAKYRTLRTENYGNGKYDFSDLPLNKLGESLLQADKIKEARAILELDTEFNPQSAWGTYLLGVAHEADGDKEKARADFQKALELNPKNGMAKRHLTALEQK